jgi:hypothetical protein
MLRWYTVGKGTSTIGRKKECMIAKLQELIDELGSLPEHLQGQAAERLEPIVDELIEQRWEELFSDPRSAAFFEQASRQIDEAITNGDVI